MQERGYNEVAMKQHHKISNNKHKALVATLLALWEQPIIVMAHVSTKQISSSSPTSKP
jgi:hypothetical protein